MKPNPSTHQPTHAYFMALRKRLNASAKWIAQHTGISQRRIEYLTAGERLINGKRVETHMTYPEQWILECVVAHAPATSGKKTAPARNQE